MNIFKKKIKAYDFGKTLYLMVLDILFNDESPIELERFISTLSSDGKYKLNDNYQIESILLISYQSFSMIFNKDDQAISYAILKGLKDRFFTHCQELGAVDNELEKLKILFDERFKQYNEAENLNSPDIIQEWVIIFLKNILSDGKGFLNVFLWLPVAEFITKGNELMAKYIELFQKKCKIIN